MAVFHAWSIPTDWDSVAPLPSPTWQYWQLVNDPANPIGYTISHGREEWPLGAYRVEAFGCQYNIATKAQAVENTRIINEVIIPAMPDDGGTLLIEDLLYTYGAIENPKRVFSTSSPLPIPFGIRGTSCRAAIVNYNPATAAVKYSWDGNNPFQYVDCYPPLELMDILIVSQGKGFWAEGIGKNFHGRNVRISRCHDTALHMYFCHGGTYQFELYCNYGIALHTNLCNTCEWDINIRETAGPVAWRNEGGSAHHFGRMYLEANYQRAYEGYDCTNFGGDLAVHLESNQLGLGADSLYPHVYLRRSKAFKFTGQTHNNGNVFDQDDESFRCNEIDTIGPEWPSEFDLPLGKLFDTGNVQFFPDFWQGPTPVDYRPTIAVEAIAITTTTVVHSITTQINVAPATYRVKSSDVGCVLTITGGTATAGTYAIVAIDRISNRWTLDRPAGSAAATVIGSLQTNDIRFDVKAGTFNHEDTFNTAWIKLFSRTDSFETINFAIGDVVRIQYDLEVDAAGLAYCRKDDNLTVTMDYGTETFTANNHGQPAGKQCFFSTNKFLPTGLTKGNPYYVINPTTNTFQVATTPGGSAVAIAQNGDGTGTVKANFSHLLRYLLRPYLQLPGINLSEVAYHRNSGVVRYRFDGRIASPGGTGAICYFFPTALISGTNEPAAPFTFWIRNVKIQRVPV